MKDAVPPAVTAWLDGCVVIAGATAAAFTVRTAPVLVAEPAEFVATAVYVPASPACTLLSASVALVAPEMFTPPFAHW